MRMRYEGAGQAEHPDAAQWPETVIERRGGLINVPWREILKYRDLLLLQVHRNFTAGYKQTVLGPLWFFMQPIVSTLVYTVIFGKLIGIPTEGVPPVLFYMCGTLAWGYFSACQGGTSSVFADNAPIFQKVYFPRLIMPLTSVAGQLLNFGLRIGLFFAFWFYIKLFTDSGDTYRVSAWLLAVPVLLVQSAALGMGVGLIISSLTAKYRDFLYMAGFVTSGWFYATPVLYPLSKVPERWQWAVALNPMTPTVEAFRLAFLGVGSVEFWQLGLSLVVTAMLLFLGLVAFSRTERTFVDTV